MTQPAQWDHIVVGAGSAGAIVAARLSEDPTCKVLLLEAGGEANRLRFRIPAMSATKVLGDPQYDWLFVTEPDPSRLDKVDVWFRGKVLGGSSQLNGTIYARGNRSDYDHWETLGNTGWSYDALLPFFRRLENGSAISAHEYGQAGPVHISPAKGVPKICHAFIKAMGEIGVPATSNYNRAAQTGASLTHFNQRRGLRESTEHAFLKEARKRPNLTVMTHTLARRIVFEGKRAIGVEFDHDGKTRIEYSRHDVVLSASAFNSAKLLMLSGIGDPDALSKHGIATVHANVHVGQHLQEHPAIPLKAFVKVRTVNQDMGVLGQMKTAIRWLFTRGGPASFIFPAIAFAKSSSTLDYPDLQFHFAPWINDIGPDGVKWLDRAGVTMLVNVNRSFSSGFVSLRSADPNDPPLIQPNMLGSREEVELLKKAVRMGRQIWKTKAFAPYFQEEYPSGVDLEDDEALEQFVRREASPSYHACGTVRMGVDESAVVDPRLRVHGTENLRVVDCSIIPQVPSGNINAISMIIGEKGATLIKEDKR
ncbi:GMC family oxidoreductase [Pseudomonas fluorescens]|uniref:Oxygen-dependent choline dehydrogenase n=1 Tax=Pseudomonas fluorescens TaxID=294 RepID=A0A5E7CGF3_PSEFL|nr:GMC family oxidoreductase N-terminal domain-containing protein [Pseudomonas fluorescens]VVO03536.1 Oxygen-dependent choline dehydrogenase [Pseudomonas fluorescens]